MSTSSTSSAAASTSSGIRSLTGAPVMVATASATESRCWMLQVLTTSMPGVEQDVDVLPALRPRRPGSVGVGELVDERDGRGRGRGWRPCPSPRRRRRGTRRAVAARSRARRAASRSPAGRAPRRTRRRGPFPARSDDAPPRASGTSCRRRAPSRGRRGGGPDPARDRPPRSGPASPRPSGGRRTWSVRRSVIGRHRTSSPSRSRFRSEDVDPRLAEEPEERLLGVTGDDGPDGSPRSCPAPSRREPPGTRRRPG